MPPPQAPWGLRSAPPAQTSGRDPDLYPSTGVGGHRSVPPTPAAGGPRFAPPPQAAGGDQIRTRYSGRRGAPQLRPLLRPRGGPGSVPPPPAAKDPHQLPSPRKGESGLHLLLWPRPTRGTQPRVSSAGRGDPDQRAIASHRGSLARASCPGAPGTFPPTSPAGPAPHSPRARCPSSWCRGREGARRATGAALRSPSPAIPSPLEIPEIEESPVRARPPPPLARRSSPWVSSAAPPPRRSSAKWPEEAPPRPPQRPPARPTPGERGEGEAREGEAREGRCRAGGGAGLTARARARPAPAPGPPSSGAPSGRAAPPRGPEGRRGGREGGRDREPRELSPPTSLLLATTLPALRTTSRL